MKPALGNRLIGSALPTGLDKSGQMLDNRGREGSAVRSVPQNDISQGPFLWSRGTAARETLRYLDRKGIDAEPLLLKAELSRDQLSPESGGISVASQHRFLELAAIETNDPLLGLHVAASTTVAEALEHLARYAGTANEAVHLEISQHQGETGLTVRPVGWYDEPWRQFSEFIALAVIPLRCARPLPKDPIHVIDPFVYTRLPRTLPTTSRARPQAP
jgi:hypothetical protein